MNIEEQIKNLKETLGHFKDIEKNTEDTFDGAVETANSMEDGEQKDWLLASLRNAKSGKLKSAEFMHQMKSRGYGG